MSMYFIHKYNIIIDKYIIIKNEIFTDFKIDNFLFLRENGKKNQYVEEYEKLLLDAICGDQTLFVSTDEVKEMWRVIDPVIETWERGTIPLNTYAADTDEASEISKKI